METSHHRAIGVFVMLTLALALLFQLAPHIDIAVSKFFFDPENVHRFPLMYDPALRFIQKSVNWLSYGLIVGLLVILAIKTWCKNSSMSVVQSMPLTQKQAGFLLLALALGPGLMVQLATKEVFERPRPVHSAPFHGEHPFAKAFELSEDTGGKSFVSGHASIGFYLAAFALIQGCAKRRIFFYVSAIMIGLTLGGCRIIQGRHFLSDVLLSGAMTLLIVHLSYWLVYRPYRLACAQDQAAVSSLK